MKSENQWSLIVFEDVVKYHLVKYSNNDLLYLLVLKSYRRVQTWLILKAKTQHLVLDQLLFILHQQIYVRLQHTCRPRVWAKRAEKGDKNDLICPDKRRPPSAEQQTHTHRSYNRCIMEQRPRWQNLSEAWGLIYLSICFTTPVLLFIIRVRFPASQSLSVGWNPRSCSLKHTYTNINTHSHWKPQKRILLGRTRTRCSEQGRRDLQPKVPECVRPPVVKGSSKEETQNQCSDYVFFRCTDKSLGSIAHVTTLRGLTQMPASAF